jgi:hypothetical protein
MEAGWKTVGRLTGAGAGSWELGYYFVISTLSIQSTQSSPSNHLTRPPRLGLAEPRKRVNGPGGRREKQGAAACACRPIAAILLPLHNSQLLGLPCLSFPQPRPPPHRLAFSLLSLISEGLGRHPEKPTKPTHIHNTNMRCVPPVPRPFFSFFPLEMS